MQQYDLVAIPNDHLYVETVHIIISVFNLARHERYDTDTGMYRYLARPIQLYRYRRIL